MVVTCLRESQNARSTNIPSRMNGSVPKEKEVVNDGRGPSEGAEAIRTSHKLPLNRSSPVNYRKGEADSCSAGTFSRPRSSSDAATPTANEGPSGAGKNAAKQLCKCNKI